MSLLKELYTELQETAAVGATSAHAVGAYHGSLFGGGVMTRDGQKKSRMKAYRMDADQLKTMKSTIKNRNAWKWRVIGEMMDPQFDPADVMSKLDAAETQANTDQDTVAFGMEDEDGNIVKVYVRSDQADEFEDALAAMLAGEDKDDDDVSDSVEIAEVLFQLKDSFDIVDVKWPNIEGDEEEEMDELGGDEEGGDAELGDLEDLEGGDEEGGDLEDLEDLEDLDLGDEEGGDELDMEPESGAEGALQQVIDMLKQDAEARAKEASAREAEAKAREAEANAEAASAKVKQEEEVLDMEAFNKKQKSEEEETKRIAKLARYQHDKASRAETMMGAEEEEMCNDDDPRKTRPYGPEDDKLTQRELVTHILDYLKAN